ncbi:MAG TPA: endo-1,4-beta-xylanase [Lacipirellulaceae bacterium]|nr:endo-1,4-beta-xylanase [Lacipirellulaceae bacterium]
MRFRLHERDRLPEDGLQRIYVAGAEDFPWSTRTSWDGDQLVVGRSVDDSGYVYVPWRVDGHGLRLLGSTTLMEREKPYLLEVELARGLVQRLRSRLFVWEWLGMVTPPELTTKLKDATALFARAATNQDDVAAAARYANLALTATLSVADELVASYSEQTLQTRQRQTPVTTLLGVTLSPQAPPVAVRRQVVDACNIVQLPVGWRAVENREGKRDWKATDDQLAWCQTAGLKVAAGPLLRMDDRGVPDWMYLWEGDDDNLVRLLLDHVRAVVSRYVGRVHLWHVASRVNNGRLMSLDEESRLNLVARAVQVVRKIDPRTPTVVSFDQPWAEYLAEHDNDLAPWHYADALVRADLGISGFGLEINAGYWPRGSAHRPVFEYGRLVDHWSQLGLPLMMLLTAASSHEPDPLAIQSIHCEAFATEAGGKDDPQAKWARLVAPLLASRPSVQVVLWNQLADNEPHEFPHAGLIDARGRAKPTLALLRELRKNNVT